MQKLGISRLAARGQVTVASDVRNRYGLQEHDILEWVVVPAGEVASKFPADSELLLAIPKRAQVLSPQIVRELLETRDEANVSSTLSLADLPNPTTSVR
jgi:bifunctional DNA-binding transcriptional regulator/antitoxin component of YhaV-PrlF toxin-antitoxin module